MKTIKTLVAIAMVNSLLVFGFVFADAKLNKKAGIEQTRPITESPSITVTIMPTRTPTPVVKKESQTNTPTPTTKPTTAPTVAETPAPTPDNRCIVSIDGVRYDVSSLRSTHTGGDIFQCGTDMTAIFYGQHDKSFLGKLIRI